MSLPCPLCLYPPCGISGVSGMCVLIHTVPNFSFRCGVEGPPDVACLFRAVAIPNSPFWPTSQGYPFEGGRGDAKRPSGTRAFVPRGQRGEGRTRLLRPEGPQEV